MSRIERVKSRLGEMLLRDRGNIDEKSAELAKSELYACLERFFTVHECRIELTGEEDGEAVLSLHARLRRIGESEK